MCCSFVAGADAKLAIKSGPYNEDVDEGVLPGAGSICLVEVWSLGDSVPEYHWPA